jgi:hypothetical protein
MSTERGRGGEKESGVFDKEGLDTDSDGDEQDGEHQESEAAQEHAGHAGPGAGIGFG